MQLPVRAAAISGGPTQCWGQSSTNTLFALSRHSHSQGGSQHNRPSPLLVRGSTRFCAMCLTTSPMS